MRSQDSPEDSQGKNVGPWDREAMTNHAVILLLSSAVLILGLVLRVDGNTGVAVPGELRLPELCMSRRMFGIQCPGCGLTRSVISMLRGDLRAAFDFNIAGPLIFVLIAFQVPYRSLVLARLARGGTTPYFPGGFWPLALIMGVTIIQWMVRGILTWY